MIQGHSIASFASTMSFLIDLFIRDFVSLDLVFSIQKIECSRENRDLNRKTRKIKKYSNASADNFIIS
mgnify:CR=1 FL=1|tara:strand:+ start:738 stop:941 length:204 start_codon:yes stop_codon:yes gene_type:complete